MELWGELIDLVEATQENAGADYINTKLGLQLKIIHTYRELEPSKFGNMLGKLAPCDKQDISFRYDEKTDTMWMTVELSSSKVTETVAVEEKEK